MLPILWEPRAWNEYLYWQATNRKTLKRLNAILKEIMRTPFEGIGKPEKLKGRLEDFWSRRLDEKNRITYYVKDDFIKITSCRGHYGDK